MTKELILIGGGTAVALCFFSALPIIAIGAISTGIVVSYKFLKNNPNFFNSIENHSTNQNVLTDRFAESMKQYSKTVSELKDICKNHKFKSEDLKNIVNNSIEVFNNIIDEHSKDKSYVIPMKINKLFDIQLADLLKVVKEYNSFDVDTKEEYRQRVSKVIDNIFELSSDIKNHHDKVDKDSFETTLSVTEIISKER